MGNIDSNISDELTHIAPASEIEVIKLAEKLEINIEDLKNTISELLNTKLETLSEEEIFLYYSVYLYLINKEKEEIKKSLEEQKKSEKKKNLESALNECLNEISPNCQNSLELLDTNQLARLIYKIIYPKRIIKEINTISNIET